MRDKLLIYSSVFTLGTFALLVWLIAQLETRIIRRIDRAAELNKQALNALTR